MTRLAVAIATTLGPVTVARITPEHPDVNSVVCIEHSDTELPISPAYNSFVRPPTGIVKKCFEHESFLLEVSGSIDVGDSWKLGVFAAHALHYASRLARSGETPDRTIWVTGDMRRDFSVAPVGYITEKIGRSKPFFEDLSKRGIPFSIILPKDNFEQLDHGRLRELGIDKAGIVPVGCANDVMAALELPALDIQPYGRQAKARWRPGAAVAASAALLFAAAGGVLWHGSGQGLSMWNPSNLPTRNLQALMSAMDIEGISTVTGGPFVMKLRPKGAAFVEVRTPDMKEWFRETGRWWVDKGSFCFHFTRFGGGTIRCPRITVKGASIEARRGDDEPLNWRFTAVSSEDLTSRDHD